MLVCIDTPSLTYISHTHKHTHAHMHTNTIAHVSYTDIALPVNNIYIQNSRLNFHCAKKMIKTH